VTMLTQEQLKMAREASERIVIATKAFLRAVEAPGSDHTVMDIHVGNSDAYNIPVPRRRIEKVLIDMIAEDSQFLLGHEISPPHPNRFDQRNTDPRLFRALTEAGNRGTKRSDRTDF